MKWIRLSMLWILFFESSFLFVEGRDMRDTLPGEVTARQLPTVIIRRQSPEGKISGDTLVFDAQRYARPTAFRLEDLLENVPGFRVDGEGRIYFNGKEISRIMIDGDGLSGEHYRLLSRNLRSMMVDKVEVIQNHQPNRLLKDFALSASPAINIKIRKEYKGKFSGSGSLGMGPVRGRQFEWEASMLRDSLKQLLFLDHNNVGGNGVAQWVARYQDQNNSSFFDLHPFSFVLSEKPIGLSQGQTFRNNDLGTSLLSSIKMRNIKLNLVASVGQFHFQQDQKINRIILQMNNMPLNLLQDIDVRRKSDEIQLRIGLEKDKSKNHLAKTFLQIQMDGSAHHHAEIRRGISNYILNIFSRERYWRMQWDHASTLRLREGWLLQHEYKIAVGKLSAATSSETFEKADSLINQLCREIFHKHGMLMENHLGWFVLQGNMKWKLGWISTLENTYSAVITDQLKYRQVKSYPYLELSWSPQKKLMLKTQAAGGVLMQGERLGKLIFVHMLEQQMQLTLKRLLQFQISSGLNKKSSDMRDLIAGTFLLRDGIIRQGFRELSVPTTFHFRMGGSQVNLNAGRSWAFSFQYRKQINEMAKSVLLNRASESWQQILSGSRHTWTVYVQGEQYVSLLKTKIRLQLNRSRTYLPQYFNGIEERMLMRSSFMDLRIIQLSNRKLGSELQYHYFKSINQLVDVNKRQYAFQQTVFLTKIWWKVNNKTNLSINYARICSNEYYESGILDMSCHLDLNRQFKLSITGQNLFDKKNYFSSVSDGFGVTTIDQQLNGRRILLMGRFMF